jgi:MSHA biogenesis protein MshQ
MVTIAALAGMRCSSVDKAHLDGKTDGAVLGAGGIDGTGGFGSEGGTFLPGAGGAGGTGETSAVGAGGVNQAGGSVGNVDLTDAGTGLQRAGLAAGCALVMHMDEASWNGSPGEVTDACGHNHGTSVKSTDLSAVLPDTTPAGYFGGAGHFDATNGCVQVPDDSSLHATTQLTLSAWIFPTTFSPASNGIIAKRTDYMVDSAYAMFLWDANSSGTSQLWADIGIDRFQGNLMLNINHWYHAAVVFDGSLATSQRVRLYVNGALDAEFAESATTLPAFASPLYVGCLPLSGPAQEFAGTIDEAVVWTRALGPDEIHALFVATTPL